MSLKLLKTLSLRTRLIVLTAFALISICTAIFVAWRLVKTTQAFTVFQTENELRANVRALARELRISPAGFDENNDLPDDSPKHPKQPPIPPHVAEILRQYQDPFVRLTAMILHPSDRISGGFYRRADDSIFGYVAKNSMPAKIESFPPIDDLKSALNEAINKQQNLTKQISSGNETYLLAVEPISANDSAAWTIERLPNFAQADWANFAALGFLVVTTFGVSIFAFATVRDLRRDTANIKSELANLELNLESELPSPETKEFAIIVSGINDLSARLRTNLAKQKQLEANLRQSEKLSALGRVASGVAHEIRNPLAAIKLKIQIAQRKEIDEKLNQTFRVVTEEIERLDKIVNRLLEFGKAQNLQLAEFDLNDLLRRRAAFFSDVAAAKNISIELENLEHPQIVNADEKRLTEVFDNLLQNALIAITDSGKILIKSSAAEDFARIEIRDTGIGIGADEREKIFEPFFTMRDDGTGLGLAITREIVEAHGGKIYFESEIGKGTTFYVELPIAGRKS